MGSLCGFFDVDVIFEGAFHSCCREFTFNPCSVGLGLVEFVFDPHSVEFNFGFCYVELVLALRFLSREPTQSLHTHTRCLHTRWWWSGILGCGGVFRGHERGVGWVWAYG